MSPKRRFRKGVCFPPACNVLCFTGFGAFLRNHPGETRVFVRRRFCAYVLDVDLLFFWRKFLGETLFLC